MVNFCGLSLKKDIKLDIGGINSKCINRQGHNYYIDKAQGRLSNRR